MYNRLLSNTKNLLPFIIFSVASGFISAILITAFKLAAEVVIHLSGTIYGAVRENPVWLPALILGTAAVGFIASLILTVSRSCRGGGIPTSVAAIRGILSFKWLASVFVLPISALLTFLCGLPLGTEGPCVQMGTAIGDGVVKCFGAKKHMGWRRYIMTGGASAGFSIATSSPITAIIFSMEELHKHFSPLVLTGASISVMTAQVTVQGLESLGICDGGGLFHLTELAAIPVKLLFAPLIVGIICGICSILFTRLYHLVNRAMHAILTKLSVKILFPIIFICVAMIGFFISDTLGTGHSLVDVLFHTRTAWYLVIIVFLIRAVAMMSANTSGVTGGVFLPTLAFGALVGSITADGMIYFGIIPEEYYTLMVVLGVISFLGATSRIPLTACVFAIEALGGKGNVLAVVIAVTVSFLIAELSGVEDFTDTMIEAKVRLSHRGSEPTIIVTTLTVAKDSLAVGKELRDVLWPNSCVVVAFEHAHTTHDIVGISEGDVITVRYKTYDPDATAAELWALVGDQSEEISRIMTAK